MSFITLPAPDIAGWPETLSDEDRPASAPPAPCVDTNEHGGSEKRRDRRRAVRAKMTRALRDMVEGWYWRTYNWRR